MTMCHFVERIAGEPSL